MGTNVILKRLNRLYPKVFNYIDDTEILLSLLNKADIPGEGEYYTGMIKIEPNIIYKLYIFDCGKCEFIKCEEFNNTIYYNSDTGYKCLFSYYPHI